MQAIFEEAFSAFLKKEKSLIETDVNERTLCARLAMILEAEAHKAGLKDYYADPDYNRKQGGRVKTIIGADSREIVINADLILHSRGNTVARDNLIAIEMKKSTRPDREKEKDRERLIAMTKSSYDDIWSADGKTHPEHVCGYEFGVFLDLDISSIVLQSSITKVGCSQSGSR